MKKRKGKLIAVEGTDGSGKGTQTKRLVRRLRVGGAAARRIAFPQYGGSFFGKMAAAYLRGEYGPARAVDPHLAALLYAADRYDAGERIARALADGTTVVLDRYVDSNKAHQAAKLKRSKNRGEFFAWVDELEYGHFKLPRPDFTLYLHVPARIASELIGRKAARAHLRGKKRDMHEADMGHLRRAEKIYLELAGACPPARGALIECVEGRRLLTVREVGERVWDVLRRHRLVSGPGRKRSSRR